MYFHKYNTRYQDANRVTIFRSLLEDALSCTRQCYKEYNNYLTDKVNKIKRLFDFISINLDYVNRPDSLSLKKVIIYKIKEFNNGIEKEYFKEYLYLLKLLTAEQPPLEAVTAKKAYKITSD